ncbi:hypothetical protein [Limibacillus sp. MBR-115]|jgi:hypothetical protein|uniref:hypothetical protein n=1 Tax=Limibacillus sp. MBR-115 TaxID=3156465 RepID=UPI00339235F8
MVMKRFLSLFTAFLIVAPLLVQTAGTGLLNLSPTASGKGLAVTATMDHTAHLAAAKPTTTETTSPSEGQPQRHHPSHGGLCALFCANPMAQSLPELSVAAFFATLQKWRTPPLLSAWRGFAEITPPPPRRA